MREFKFLTEGLQSEHERMVRDFKELTGCSDMSADRQASYALQNVYGALTDACSVVIVKNQDERDSLCVGAYGETHLEEMVRGHKRAAIGEYNSMLNSIVIDLMTTHANVVKQSSRISTDDSCQALQEQAPLALPDEVQQAIAVLNDTGAEKKPARARPAAGLRRSIP